MGDRPLHTAVREPRGDARAAAPLLLLLHGYGSDEADLLGLAQHFGPRLRVVSARAPVRLEAGGYAWFPIEFTAVGLAVDYAAGERSLARLEALLAALQSEHGNDGRNTIVLGFSQGGAMALGLLLAQPSRVGGVAFLSGLWSAEGMPTDPAVRAAVRGRPVLQTHGTADPLIPIARARRTRALLEELGLDLTYREYPMGHGIDDDCLADIVDWLGRRLPAD